MLQFSKGVHMLSQLSFMGLLENLSILGPLLMLILMPIGFIASAWVTNSVCSYFRPDVDELTMVDRVGTFLLLIGLFASYAYMVCVLFLE